MQLKSDQKNNFFTEIREYASKIGIDPDKEPHLLYIARDGLMQALPPNWAVWYVFLTYFLLYFYID